MTNRKIIINRLAMSFIWTLLTYVFYGLSGSFSSNVFLRVDATIIFIVIGLYFVFHKDKYMQQYFVESRQKVNEQFLKIGIDEEDHQYALKGSSATIVQDEESDGGYEVGPPEYHLTRFVRNHGGEYFMLKYLVRSGEVSLIFMKHIMQTNARIALKEKYLPPPQKADLL